MFDDQMPQEDDRPKGENSPDFRTIRSKYEFVMAAAKEAERLNDRYRNIGVRTNAKVTVEAIDRVRRQLSRFTYEEPQSLADEAPKEATYFFGS